MEKQVFDEIGLFDERFKIGSYEDDDIFLRMAFNGWCYGEVNTVPCFHRCHGTLDKEFAQYGGATGLCFINREVFIDKWGGTGEGNINMTQVFLEHKYGKVTGTPPQ